MFVEQIPFRWADKIKVEREGDTLKVSGQNAMTEAVEPQSPDLLKVYAEYAKHSKPIPGHLRGGRLAPHIEFANAATDDQLVRFVSLYGPVNGLRPMWMPLRMDEVKEVTVIESLLRLRREQMVFAATLHLASAIREESDRGIADALGDLAHACFQGGAGWELPHEIAWHGHAYLSRLNAPALEAGWQDGMPMDEVLRGLPGNLAREYGRYMLCLILNGFPSMLVPAKRGLVEMPQLSKTGILPALFFMLRRDCLLDQEIRICDRLDCGKFFKVERGGQRFCSTECSQLQRQRDYWVQRGKTLRTKRMAYKQTKKGGNKRGTV